MASIISWQDNTSNLTLISGDIHVWRISLLAEELEKRYQILNEIERERADRFHFPEHRRRFIAAHYSLRIILSRYSGISPEKINFTLNNYGKPHLLVTENLLSLEFNLSHSGEYALLGLTLNHALGVDIEHMNKAHAEAGIAQRFFSAREYADFCRVPDELKKQAFYNAWTRKEAFIKAVGKGLSYPLDQFDVSLDPEHPVKILHIAAEPNSAESWNLIAFTPAEEYVAAIATKQTVKNIYYWDF